MVVGLVIIVVFMKEYVKGCIYLDCLIIEMIWKYWIKYLYDVIIFLFRKNIMVIWNYFI